MPTKKELLEEANRDFPRFYESRRQYNPDYMFRPGQDLPQVSGVMIFSARYEPDNSLLQDSVFPEKEVPDETEEAEEEELLLISKVEGYLKLRTRKGRNFHPEFFCYSDGDDAQCFLRRKYSRNIAHFAKIFIEFFLYEFLSRKGIAIDDWNGLDIDE